MSEPVKVSVDTKKAILDAKTLRRLIAEHWNKVAPLLPKHMTEARFGGLIMSAVQKDTKLLGCTGISLLTAIHQAASLGLEINAATGEAYLIPYKINGVLTATLVPGYKGLVKLAYNSKIVKAIDARLVYKGEVKRRFKVRYGTNPGIDHEPDFDVPREVDDIAFAYAVATMPDGATTFEVMSRKQIDVIKTESLRKTQGKGVWSSVNADEMYRKTPTRRLTKLLPMSAELAQAIELADRAETGEYEHAGPSAGTDSLNRATAKLTTFEDCLPTCRVENGALIHDGECPHFADD